MSVAGPTALAGNGPALVRARWAVSLLFLVNGVTIGSWAPHIPYIQARLEVGEALLGTALLFMAVGGLAAMLLAGGLCNRFGSAPTVLAAGFALCLFVMGPPLAPGFGLLCLAGALFGFTNGMMDVAMNAQALTIERAMGKPVISSFHGFWSIGGLSGASAAGLAFSLGMSPETHIILVGLTALVLIGCACSFLVPDKNPDMAVGLRIRLPRGVVLAIGCLAFVSMMLEGAVLDWSSVFLHGTLDVTVGWAAYGYASFAAAMSVARLVGDRIVAWLGRARVLFYSALMTSAGMLIFALAPAFWIAIGGCILAGLGLGNVIPLLFAAGARAPGYSHADGVAAVTMLGVLGFLVGPVAIGFVAEISSLRVSLTLVSLGILALPLSVGAIFSRLDRS